MDEREEDMIRKDTQTSVVLFLIWIFAVILLFISFCVLNIAYF